MEKRPKLKSISKYYELTSLDQLHEYVETLQFIYNTPEKYQIVDNEVRTDNFGSPYIIFQYFENDLVEDRLVVKAVFHGVIYSIPSHLEEFDKIATKHINDELKMFFVQDYQIKDKENPLLYRLVMYLVPNEEPITKDSETVTPKKGK